jgi:hypothetical protein
MRNVPPRANANPTYLSSMAYVCMYMYMVSSSVPVDIVVTHPSFHKGWTRWTLARDLIPLLGSFCRNLSNLIAECNAV